jgi:hypothetical protein
MATLTVQNVDTDGVAPAYVAAAGGGDDFTPTDTTSSYFIHIKNGGGSSINIVMDDPTTVDPGAATAFNPDVTVAVTNAQERMLRVNMSRYLNSSSNKVAWTYSGVTTVTIGVFRVAG